MSRRCELTGKATIFGHNVSHSNVKTNRRFMPNLQHATLYSDALRTRISLRVCTRALRTVQRHGGLDGFLLHMADEKLAPEALRLKRRVKRSLSRGPRKPAAATPAAS